MAKEIISFRISEDAFNKIEQLKKEKKISSTAEYLNGLIMQDTGPTSNLKKEVRVIPEQGINCYIGFDFDIVTKIKISSTLFCNMSIKRHAEARKIIEQNGLGYFYFPVAKDMSMAIIAANKEEASIQFQRYYTMDKETGEYERTSVSLPQYRYDPINKNVIIFEGYE